MMEAKTISSSGDRSRQQTGGRQRKHPRRQTRRARNSLTKPGVEITAAAVVVAVSHVFLDVHDEKKGPPSARKHGRPSRQLEQPHQHIPSRTMPHLRDNQA